MCLVLSASRSRSPSPILYLEELEVLWQFPWGLVAGRHRWSHARRKPAVVHVLTVGLFLRPVGLAFARICVICTLLVYDVRYCTYRGTYFAFTQYLGSRQFENNVVRVHAQAPSPSHRLLS